MKELSVCERARMFREKHPGYYSDKCRNWRNADPERSRLAQRRWEAKNKEKVLANKKLGYALRKGTIQRQPCVVCGELKVHAHHTDYSKPLQVEWLCVIHHKLQHRKNTKLNTQSKTINKRYQYRTAKALISCAYFNEGEIVGVQYYGRGQEGVHYFLCAGQDVCYPEHHLTQFCF